MPNLLALLRTPVPPLLLVAIVSSGLTLATVSGAQWLQAARQQRQMRQQQTAPVRRFHRLLQVGYPVGAAISRQLAADGVRVVYETDRFGCRHYSLTPVSHADTNPALAILNDSTNPTNLTNNALAFDYDDLHDNLNDSHDDVVTPIARPSEREAWREEEAGELWPIPLAINSTATTSSAMTASQW